MCGPGLEAACATCEDREYRLSPWFSHIDTIYKLWRSGFPFRRDELSLEVWFDLGTYKQLLDDERETRFRGQI